MKAKTRTSFVVAAAWACIAVDAIPAQQVDYNIVDRIEDDWLNRNPVPVRPMALDLDGSIWAVNPYLGAICKINGSTVQSFRTLPGPVSVAIQPSGGRIYVACQHANAVAVHSTLTGDIIDVVHVRAQPQDLLLNAAGRLWVSCAAADVVVSFDTAQIDQTSPPTLTTYEIPSKIPTFLTLGPGDQILVAPRVSGNGSVVDRIPDQPRVGSDPFPNGMAGPRGIIDTLLSSEARVGLQDNDLFWLEPSSGATGLVTPIAKNTGTLLFAGAIRPTTGEFWQLNTDANNKNPALQSEAAIRGNVVANRITIVTLPSLTHPVTVKTAADHSFKVLDITGRALFPNTQLGLPYSIAFRADGARCWVAGLLTDNIVEFNASGQRTGRAVKFGKGSMPRQVMYGLNNSTLHVWCADNKVRTHVLTTATTTAVSVGFDPTPTDIIAGRKLFFDGSHSLLGNSSCASCHDEGKTDMLAWNLSKVDVSLAPDDGFDNKGPMVTQTLVGIDRARPFHWRGEQKRGLIDFNDAFVNLLGGTKIDVDNGDFAKFERYVLSLTEDANQFEHPLRKLPSLTTTPSTLPSGSPSIGQSKFTFGPPNNPLRCIDCHNMPTGTSNDVVSNIFELDTATGDPVPRRLWIKVAPFQGIQYKAAQPQEMIDLTTGLASPLPMSYPVSGTGLSHAGVINNIHTFTAQMSPLMDPDIAHFVLRFDTGIAPAAHCAAFRRPGEANNGPLLPGQLLAQALTPRNCDLVAFGRRTINGVSRVAGWSLVRSSGLFLRDDGVLETPQTLLDNASASGTSNWLVSVGLPVGMGRGYAIDFDRDGLLNMQEPSIAGAEFNVDSDLDMFWDGHEAANGGDPANPLVTPDDHTQPVITFLPDTLVPATPGPRPYQWHTQRVARLTFETNELTTAELTLTASGMPPVVVSSNKPKLQHNLLAPDLLPGRTYTSTLVVRDLANLDGVVIDPLSGLPVAPVLPDVITPGSPSDVFRSAAVIKSLTWNTPGIIGGGSIRLQPSGEVMLRNDGSALGNARVIARVLLNGRPVPDAQLSGPSEQASFRVGGINYQMISGPFVIAPVSGSAGQFAMDFTLSGVASGSSIELSIEAIGDQISAGPPINIRSSLPSLPQAPPQSLVPQLFSFPDTDADKRIIKIIMP